MRKVTKEELKKLYQAASAFKKAKPWTVLKESQVTGIISPDLQLTAYCSVTCEPPGLTLYVGKEKLESVRKCCSPKKEEENILLTISETLRHYILRCEMENKNNLSAEQARRLNELGMRFRGEYAWPSCTSYLPGQEARMIESQKECSLLTCALEQMTLLAGKAAKGQYQISDIERAEEMLFLVPEEKGSLKFRYEMRKTKHLKNHKPEYYLCTDRLKLERIKRLPYLYDTVQCTLLLLPLPMKGEKEVFNPMVMIAMDMNSEQVVFNSLAGDEEGAGYKERKVWLLNEWAQEMVQKEFRPRSILTDTEESYELLKDLCIKADIKLEKQKLDSRIYEAVVEMAKSLVLADMGLTEEEEEGLFTFREEDLDDYIEEILDNFMKDGLKSEVSQDKRRIIAGDIDTFIRLMYEKLDEAPEEWTQHSIHLLFSEIIPAQVACPQEDLEMFPQSVVLFLKYLDELSWNKTYEPAVKMIERNSSAYIAKAEDAEEWGIIKKAAMKALSEGIDLGDRQAVEKYIGVYLEGYQGTDSAQISSRNKK